MSANANRRDGQQEPSRPGWMMQLIPATQRSPRSELNDLSWTLAYIRTLLAARPAQRLPGFASAARGPRYLRD